MHINLELQDELTMLDDDIALAFMRVPTANGIGSAIYECGLKRELQWRQEAIRSVLNTPEETNSIDIHLFIVETKDILKEFIDI